MTPKFHSISHEKGCFDYPLLSDFEWKPQLKITLIFVVLTKQCMKKVVPVSKDFVPNGFGGGGGHTRARGTRTLSRYNFHFRAVFGKNLVK